MKELLYVFAVNGKCSKANNIMRDYLFDTDIMTIGKMGIVSSILL